MTIWRFWISDCKFVLILVSVFAIDCSNVAQCVCVCVCVCVWGGNRVTSQRGVTLQLIRNRLNRSLCANTYELHHCVCHATLFPFQAWTDGKTKDIINCLYIYFESQSSWLWKGALHFRRVLVVFGQLHCTGSAGQSEQTVLVGRRGFVAFERGIP